MKRFRMKKEKIIKPDGRWMYLYTFEEEPESQPFSEGRAERETNSTPSESEEDSAPLTHD